MPVLRRCLPLPILLGLAACTSAGPIPGTPEFAAAQVSRGYDCGVRVDHGRVMARLPRDDRQRFMAANAAFAVKSYKAPRSCDSYERASIQRDLAALARR